jgi:hypothetical protein
MTLSLGWLQALLAPAVVSAFVTSVLLWLLKSRDERSRIAIKASFDADLERMKADLGEKALRIDATQRAIESRLQTRYSWLYEKRATVMQQIYSELIDADNAFDDFVRSFGRFGHLPGQRGPKKRAEAARKATQAFVRSYQPQRLLFSRDVAAKLDDLNRAYVGVMNSYDRFLMIEGGDEDAAFNAMYKAGIPEIPSYREDLETEFRRLYGTMDEGT